jgi:heat shock protein HtpX
VPHRLANALRTLALLAAMAVLAGYLGWVLFGADGLVVAAASVTLAAALAPRVSPRLVLRLSGAAPLAPSQAPGLYRLVAALAERAALPRVPRLWYVPTQVMNAFATGHPEDGAIAVTDGLLRRLAPRELAGVLAHEVAHLAANDVWVMTLADVVGRMTGLLSFFGQMLLLAWLPAAALAGAEVPVVPLAVMVLAPVASALLQLALLRTREYDADARGAELTGDPMGLAAALATLDRLQGGWLERLFMARPPRWLRTHPETGERIRRLAEIERAWRRERAALPWDYGDDPFFGGPEIRRRPRWHWSGLWY